MGTWGKAPGRVADLTPQSGASAKVKIVESYVSTSLYTIFAWCLINFNLLYIYLGFGTLDAFFQECNPLIW